MPYRLPNKFRFESFRPFVFFCRFVVDFAIFSVVLPRALRKEANRLCSALPRFHNLWENNFGREYWLWTIFFFQNETHRHWIIHMRNR